MDPTNLVLLDHARPEIISVDRMRLSSCNRYDYVMIHQRSPQKPYLRTVPVGGRSEHPVRRINFVLRCHDQGYHDDGNGWRGTWAWIEAAVYRPRTNESGFDEVNFEKEIAHYHRGHMVEATRAEIVRCKFADKVQQVYSVTWDEEHPIVKLLRLGDRVGAIPRAQFPGWENHIYGIEIHLVSEY